MDTDQRTKKLIFHVLLSLVAVFSILVIFHFGLFFLYQDRVYKGVIFAGEDLSGKSFSEAEEIVTKKLTDFEKEKVSFSSENFSLRVSLSDMNFDFDEKELIDRITSYGRSGNIFQDFQDEVRGFSDSQNFYPNFYYDDQVFDQLHEVIAERSNFESKNADLVLAEGDILIEDTEEKREVDLGEMEEAFKQAVINFEILVEVPLKKGELTLSGTLEL